VLAEFYRKYKNKFYHIYNTPYRYSGALEALPQWSGHSRLKKQENEIIGIPSYRSTIYDPAITIQGIKAIILYNIINLQFICTYNTKDIML